MKPTAIDLDTKQLFQPHVAQAYARPEVVEERELAGLVGRLEGHRIESEFGGEAIGQRAIEGSRVIEESNSLGALPRFDYQFASARVQPAVALRNQVTGCIRADCAGVLPAELKLHLQAALASHCQHLAGTQRHIGEALPTLDSREADIRAEIQVVGKPALRHRDFERTAAGHGRHSILLGSSNL